MKRFLLTVIVILFIQSLFAEIPVGYYDNATGTSYVLKTQLYNIIDGHTERTYTNLWTDMQSTDKKANGFVWDMYSDVPGGSPAYDYTFVTNQCGTYGSEGDCYNREHSFPKSWFNEGTPMYTDLFHLYPTDGKVNGQRSNYPFGEVGSASWTSTNGSKLGTCDYPGYSGTVFEPIDEYKGDFARTYFYMATRYENIIAGWENNTTYSNAVLDGTSNHVYEDWYLNMMIEWHNNDPVSQKEIDRNDAVYAIQNNRNPFIDHPEYVAKIWGGTVLNNPPVISNAENNPTKPTSSDAVSVSATITDSDGNIASSELHWGLNSGSLSSTIPMSVTSGNTYSTNSDIHAQIDGTIVYYVIEATDDSLDVTTSAEYYYTVDDNPPVTILDEDFASCPATDWTTYSVAGSENWECGTGVMQVNAYGSDAACDDWIISPVLDLDSYENEVLSFTSWTKYQDTYYPPIEVKYSTNYSGSGNPSSASWTDLTATWSAENSEAWTGSSDIDLSAIAGSQVYITFRYTSSGTGSGTSASWKIDDILITGNESTSTNETPVITNISFTPSVPESTESVSVSATINDSDGTIASAIIKWGTSTGNYLNEVSLTADINNYSGLIPAQPDKTHIYFVVYTVDNDGGSVQSTEQDYIVDNPNVLPQISNINFSPSTPESTESVSVSATITDSDGTIVSAIIKWGTTAGLYNNNVTLSANNDVYSGVIPTLSDGISVYFVIYTTDNEAGSTQSIEYNYTVKNPIPPLITDVIIDPSNPTEDENVNIYATVSDTDGTIVSVILKWKRGAGTYTDVTMNLSGEKYSGQIPKQTTGETIYFTIVASDNDDLETNHDGSYEISESSGIANLFINNLKIYPNPTKNKINIEMDELHPINTIKLYNLIGENILSINDLNNVIYTVNLSNHPKGIYILQISCSQNTIVRKIMLK